MELTAPGQVLGYWANPYIRLTEGDALHFEAVAARDSIMHAVNPHGDLDLV